LWQLLNSHGAGIPGNKDDGLKYQVQNLKTETISKIQNIKPEA